MIRRAKYLKAARTRCESSPRGTVCGRRQGFSLIEVMLATAILMGSVIVLARLAGMGRTTGQKAQRYAEAQTVCEQTLNEIVLGLRPLETVQQATLQPVGTFADEAAGNPEAGSAAALYSVQQSRRQWTYSVQTQPLEAVPGLTLLSVTVNSIVPEGSISRPTSFRLSRWVKDSTEAGSKAENSAVIGAPASFGDFR